MTTPIEEPSQSSDVRDYEYEKELYAVFQEERKILVEHEHSYDQAVNTALITISSGALGISLVILKDFAVPFGPASRQLGYGWLLLVVALLLALVAAKLNQQAHSRFREILEEEFSTSIDGALQRVKLRQRASLVRKSLIFVEWTSLVLCIAGTTLVFVFFFSGLLIRKNSDAGLPPTATSTSSPDQTD